MSRDLPQERAGLRAAAERLAACKPAGPEHASKLAEVFEALYHLAGDKGSISELRTWLESLSPRPPAARPWIALTRLAAKAESSSGDPAGDLGFLDASLPIHPPSVDLFLRTEAARLLYQLTRDAALASSRIADDPPPTPAFRETAVEIAVVRLRLAAAAGDWKNHDHLADALDEDWRRAVGPRAGWVMAVAGQHAVERGAYAVGLRYARPLQDHPDPEIRLAGLEVCLHALLTSGGDLEVGVVRSEIDRVTARMAPLLEQPAADAEGWERRRRCELLLRLARSRGAARQGDPEEELQEVATALENGGSGLAPEARLSLTLRWVRLALELRGAEAAETCEDLAGSALEEARALGLPFLEMLAWDQRAMIRARYFNTRWDEAVADAGRAANLAARLLEMNRESHLERPLRANLLPVFDRAIELLAEGAWYAVRREPAEVDRHERFGRALHDYAEQLADLALSEARTHILSGGMAPPGFPMVDELARGKRSEDLQATLRPDEAVLQYLLVGRFLLVFAFGQNFFGWEVQSPDIRDLNPPLPIRAYLEENYLGSWMRLQREQWTLHGVRDVKISGLSALTRTWASSEDCLRELAAFIIPPATATALENHGIQYLSIVPHDVLYQTPFGSLPWRKTHLGARFTLSLHPTGELAGRSSAGAHRSVRLPLQVGFFKGPALAHTDGEQAALTAAFRRFAEVRLVDTVQQGPGALTQRAPSCDILYLACHGSENRLALGPLGSAGISLREAAELDLHLCKIVMLQACRTGWMRHRRESPVQGFPQALLDAGAAAVVAPMFPVHDALCPLFASVFGRALRFLPACNALGFTLHTLRKHGAMLLSSNPDTEPFANVSGAFDAYEYRFTGDTNLRLPGGWLRRRLARIGFAVWLGYEIGHRQWLTSRRARRSGRSMSPV